MLGDQSAKISELVFTTPRLPLAEGELVGADLQEGGEGRLPTLKTANIKLE